jgi:hypothetical protein
MELVTKHIFNCDGDCLNLFYVDGREVTYDYYQEKLDDMDNTCDGDCANCDLYDDEDDEDDEDESETVNDIITRYRERIKDNHCFCDECLDTNLDDFYNEILEKILDDLEDEN